MPRTVKKIRFEEEEDSFDLGPTQESLNKTVVFSTDWTVATLLDQLIRENIDINPRFQRRDVWKIRQKSRFIESLILQLPIPHIVLAEKKEQKGKYLVLDGRQRLLTMMQFTGAATQSKNNNFPLKGLDVIEEIKNKTWGKIKKDHNDLSTAMENFTIRTVVIRAWDNDRVLHLIFKRLNTESVRLNAQELRLAAYAGPFVYFVDDLSVSSIGVKDIFGITKHLTSESSTSIDDAADPRMRDVELLVRYFAFRNFLDDYKGSMRPFLDDTCKKLNILWTKQEAKIKQQAEQFEKAVRIGREIFGPDLGKRYEPTEKKYAAIINRAVLDVQLFSFSQLSEQKALAKKNEIQKSMQELFDNNNFVESINLTARHARESAERFSLWRDSLEAIGLVFSK